MSSREQCASRTVIVASTEVVRRELRLDPSRYNERAERVLRHIRMLPLPSAEIGTWPAVRDVFVPPRFKRPYVESGADGVPFLGSSSMLALRLLKGMRLARGFRLLPRLMITGGEILVSCSGTIGECALCGDSYRGFAVSQHAARIRATEDSRGYLYAYLSSPLGRELLLQQDFGKVIQEINEEQIRKIVVPLADSATFARVNRMILDAVGLYDAARKCLDDLDQQVCVWVGSVLGESVSDAVLSRSGRNLIAASNSLFHQRLDPHCHDPSVVSLRAALQGVPHRHLDEVAEVWMPPRFARSRADSGHGVPFYSSGEIMRARRKARRTVAVRAERYLRECRVTPGMTLICRSGAFGGIMGRAAFVSAGMNGWAITEDMVRCRGLGSEFSPEYVFAYLSNPVYGYRLLTSLRYGKDVPHIDPGEMGSIPIPTLTTSARSALAEQVRTAHEYVDRANKLEQEAQRELLAALAWPASEGYRPTTSGR